MRGAKRALFRANSEAVAGVLDVDAGDDLAIDALDRATDGKAGIGCVGLQCGLASGGDQLFVGHVQDLGIQFATVTPAKAGVPLLEENRDSRFRGKDVVSWSRQ